MADFSHLCHSIKNIFVRRLKVIRRPGKAYVALVLVLFSLLYLSLFTLSEEENDESYEVNNFGSNKNLLVKKSR